MPSNSDHIIQISLFTVFENAAPFQKALIFVLVLASVAALVVMALKLGSGRRLSRGSAYLSGLRLGGPIIGLLGACRAAFGLTQGIGHAVVPVTLRVLAPGLAEIALMFGLGVLTGVIAVFANWVVESRIDRPVLKA